MDKDELSGSGEELQGVGMVGRWVGGVGGETNSGRRGEGTGGGRGQEGGEDRRGEGTEGLGGDSCRKGGSLMGL